jgi:hypothetical protein
MIFVNLLRDFPPLVSRIARPWVTRENVQASSLRQPDGALLSPGRPRQILSKNPHTGG